MTPLVKPAAADFSSLIIDAGRVSIFCVRVEADATPGAQNFALHAHDETYLGKDCRVSGFEKAAWLVDADTAEAFAAARREHLRELYGVRTSVIASSVRMPLPNTERQRHRLVERMLADTARVRDRLRSGQFAPNVAPPRSE